MTQQPNVDVSKTFFFFCLKTACEAGSGVKIWKKVYKEKYKRN